jgi:hypothetical protein
LDFIIIFSFFFAGEDVLRSIGFKQRQTQRERGSNAEWGLLKYEIFPYGCKIVVHEQEQAGSVPEKSELFKVVRN